jgi:cytochrome c biogenesis protein CcmG, thiol:disulfide interchange protein DsbE
MSKSVFTKERIYLFAPLIIFIILSILFWRGLSLDPTAMPSALINKPFPAFDLPILAAAENPAGITRANQEMLKGKPTLVNVWATWCVTCRVEHEFLNQLKAQGIPIYGVNYKDNNEDAQRWLRELHNPMYSVLSMRMVVCV